MIKKPAEAPEVVEAQRELESKVVEKPEVVEVPRELESEVVEKPTDEPEADTPQEPAQKELAEKGKLQRILKNKTIESIKKLF